VSDHGAIDEQVRELVRSHRPELEQLVDQALERELAQLVEQRLAARNGPHQAAGNAAIVETAAATKTCAGPCGRALPLSAFEKGRTKCRECRRAENRDREQRRAAQQAPADPDRPATMITADELADRVRRYHSLGPAELAHWLLDRRLATVENGLLRPTEAAVELGAAIG
jgi:hypothetical protein